MLNLFCLLFLMVVNHTLISSYSDLNVFKKIWFVGEFLISYQTAYLEQINIILLNLADNDYWQYPNEGILTL